MFKNITPSTLLGAEKEDNSDEVFYELYLYSSEAKSISLLADNITFEGISNIQEISGRGLYLIEKTESTEGDWMKTKYEDGEPALGGGFFPSREAGMINCVS